MKLRDFRQYQDMTFGSVAVLHQRCWKASSVSNTVSDLDESLRRTVLMNTFAPKAELRIYLTQHKVKLLIK